MTGLMRWNPVHELRRLLGEFERRLSTWSRPGSEGAMSTMGRSSVKQGWRLSVGLPGIAPENVEVNVAERTVHVRAIEKEGDTVVTYYEQVLTVPDFVDTENIAASYRHGLLELTLPYKDAVKPRRIEIVTDEHKQLQAA